MLTSRLGMECSGFVIIKDMLKKRCFHIGLKDWFPGDDRDENAPCFEYALATSVTSLRLMNHKDHQVKTRSRFKEMVLAEVLDTPKRGGVSPESVGSQHYQQIQNILDPCVLLEVVNALLWHALLVLYCA